MKTISRETYTKLTKSRSYLRNKLQSVFILSNTFFAFLLIFTLVKILYKKFDIIDIIPIVVYLPLYLSTLVRKIQILIYRNSNDIKM